LCLFNGILDHGFIDNWQHFFGGCLGCGQESRAKPSGRQYRFSDNPCHRLINITLTPLIIQGIPPVCGFAQCSRYPGINGEKTFSVRRFALTILKFFHYSFTTAPQERMSSFFGKVLAKKAL
jgi:hypothetical protein